MIFEPYNIFSLFPEKHFGQLLFATKKDFLLKVKNLKSRIHYWFNDYTSYAAEYVPVTNAIMTEFPEIEKEDRVLINLSAPITTDEMFITFVEFAWDNGYIFVYPKLCEHANPYMGGLVKKHIYDVYDKEEQLKDFIEDEERNEVEKKEKEDDQILDCFNAFLEEITGKKILVNEEHETITLKDEETIRYDIDPTRPVYCKPVDDETPFVPFWFNLKHWTFYATKFKYCAHAPHADKLMCLVFCKNMTEMCMQHCILNYTQNKSVKIAPDNIHQKFGFDAPQLLDLYEANAASSRNYSAFIEELLSCVTKCFLQLIPRSEHHQSFYTVDFKSRFGLFRYEKTILEADKWKLSFPLPPLFKMYYGLPVMLSEEAELDHLVMCVQNNTIVGCQIHYKQNATDTFLSEEPEVVYGTMTPPTTYLDAFNQAWEKRNQALQSGLCQTQSGLDQYLKPILMKAVNDIPFFVYWTNALDVIIYHSFLPTPLIINFNQNASDKSRNNLLKIITEQRQAAEVLLY